MFRRFGLLCAALALFGIAGGQYGVAQSVAWARMLRDYSRQTGSVTQAVARTFDGQHPCALCLQIAAAKIGEKQAEKKASEPSSKSSKRGNVEKSALPNVPTFPARPAIADAGWASAKGAGWTARRERPSTPPPRA